jgi:hypothetical protein
MKTLYRKFGPIGGILLCTLALPGCADEPDPVLAAAQTPLMLGDSSADRIVALQTRTMLAGLACGSEWGDPQAFVRYANFTVRNAAVLRRSQQELAERMGGMEEFDRMHTRISNGESKRMLAMGGSAYCAEMRGPFYIAVSLDPEGLARESQVAQASAQ